MPKTALCRTVTTPCIVVPLFDIAPGRTGGSMDYIPTDHDTAVDWAVYEWSIRCEAFVLHDRATDREQAAEMARKRSRELLKKWGAA